MREFAPVIISVCCALAFSAAAAETGPPTTPFAPQPMVLAPDPPPVPMPENFGGEPLPAPAEKDFLIKQALQLSAPGPVAPDEASRRAQVTALFAAVADGKREEINSLVAEGVDVNSPLPLPADPQLVQRFRNHDTLHYFLTVEHGLTPLMLAAGLGNDATVRLLLAHGASLSARTKRHKTFALWLAGKGKHVEVMQTLLGVAPDSDAARFSIEIDLAAQTATLFRDGLPGEPVPVSTGREGFATAAGEYVVTDKHRRWRSTLYPADMPYFMRLSCGEIGLHEGHLPGYPASHGCIRLNRRDAAEFFKKIPVGTRVVIK